MRARFEEHRTAIGSLVGVVCLGLSVLWLVVVPSEADGADGPERWILEYGHSVVWLLLGLTVVLVALRAPARLWRASAVAAGVAYAGFVATLVF